VIMPSRYSKMGSINLAQRMQRRPSCPTAFSLIEVLVVIGIIVLLIGAGIGIVGSF